MSDMAASLADVKAQLKITDTTDDAYLTALIEDVTDYVQEYIGAYVVAHNGVTTLLDTAAGAVLRVPFGVRTSPACRSRRRTSRTRAAATRPCPPR
jgi:hypothetical protein